jgi:hypothetical protein
MKRRLICAVVILSVIIFSVTLVAVVNWTFKSKQENIIARNEKLNPDTCQTSLVVLALARNIETQMSLSLQLLRQLKDKIFPRLKLIVLENGSIDDTRGVLEREPGDWITVISPMERTLRKLESVSSSPLGIGLSRIKRMAILRNDVRKQAMELQSDIIMVIDLDLDLSTPLQSIQRAVRMCETREGIAAVTSVGLVAYWGFPVGGWFRDSFAWEQNAETPQLGRRQRGFKMNSLAYLRRRDIETVTSNFGGLAVYPSPMFFSPEVEYATEPDFARMKRWKMADVARCEHTLFHERLPGEIVIDHNLRTFSRLNT